MTAADLILAALVGVGGGLGAFIGLRVRGDVPNATRIAALCGAAGAVAFLILKPALFGA